MGNKKRVRVRRSRSTEIVPEFKPTLEIRASQLGGKDVDVGETISVVVTGKVIGENIEDYGPDKGKKRFRIQVTKLRMA